MEQVHLKVGMKKPKFLGYINGEPLSRKAVAVLSAEK